MMHKIYGFFSTAIIATSCLFGAEEKTFTMIKPRAVQEKHIGSIVEMIEKSGLRVAAIKMQKLSKEQAESFYAEHKNRPFFPELVSMITSGPVVALCVEGDNAVTKLREVVGATDPKKAAPGTIRNAFGKDITNNAIHASDSTTSAQREVQFFFSAEQIY